MEGYTCFLSTLRNKQKIASCWSVISKSIVYIDKGREMLDHSNEIKILPIRLSDNKISKTSIMSRLSYGYIDHYRSLWAAEGGEGAWNLRCLPVAITIQIVCWLVFSKVPSNDKKFSCLKSNSAIFKTVNADYVNVVSNLFQIMGRNFGLWWH